jgi:predicted negative regulator of RcsB-dependent stress response
MRALVDAEALPREFGGSLRRALEKNSPWQSRAVQDELLRVATQEELSLVICSMPGIERAAVLYDTFEKAAREADLPLMGRSLADLQNQFGRTTYAQQAALLSARLYANKANLPEAEKSLQWVVDNGQEEGYVALARLRLSALALEQKNLDKAKALLQGQKAPVGFQPLFDDRLGDIAVLQNKPEEAKPLYLSAYKGLEAANEYRRLIDYKLASLGVSTADIEKKQ